MAVVPDPFARSLEDAPPLPAPPRLTLRFALLAGLALVLAAGVGAWVSGSRAGSQARDEVRADTRAIADRLAGDDLAATALQAPARGQDAVDLDELFRQQTLDAGIVRVTLYDRNARITYSTDHDLIGRRLDVAHVGDALGGKSWLGRDGDMLRAFVPVHWLLADTRFPNGVLAVDHDWAPVARDIRTQTLTQAATITLALLLLYAASFPILRRVTATLAARNRELNEQAHALRSSEAQYRLIVETAAEGVWVVDASGRTVFANEKLARLLGYELGELLGRPLTEFVDGTSRGVIEGGWLRDRNVRADARELVLLRKDGTPVYATVATSPVLEAGQYAGALVMVTDATGQKHMAHDFSNVITAITGYTDLLLDQLPENDPRQRDVERIRDAADAAVKLTRQLVRPGS
jgi:PAS domain S-box-containing protein